MEFVHTCNYTLERWIGYPLLRLRRSSDIWFRRDTFDTGEYTPHTNLRTNHLDSSHIIWNTKSALWAWNLRANYWAWRCLLDNRPCNIRWRPLGSRRCRECSSWDKLVPGNLPPPWRRWSNSPCILSNPRCINMGRWWQGKLRGL